MCVNISIKPNKTETRVANKFLKVRNADTRRGSVERTCWTFGNVRRGIQIGFLIKGDLAECNDILAGVLVASFEGKTIRGTKGPASRQDSSNMGNLVDTPGGRGATGTRSEQQRCIGLQSP